MERRVFAGACCTTPTAMCLWVAVFVLFYGGALLLTSVWPAVRPFGDTLILLALAAACFVNFGRNRTLHCGITGPAFLIGAVLAALIESGLWAGDMSIVWGVVLVAVGIAFVIEWYAVGPGHRQSEGGSRT